MIVDIPLSLTRPPLGRRALFLLVSRIGEAITNGGSAI